MADAPTLYVLYTCVTGLGVPLHALEGDTVQCCSIVPRIVLSVVSVKVAQRTAKS